MPSSLTKNPLSGNGVFAEAGQEYNTVQLFDLGDKANSLYYWSVLWCSKSDTVPIPTQLSIFPHRNK